ncbi:hypothetical protein JTB14_012260 [Gonioctena quinquepunctata]|nr:hypothetical protein JTB14_012260 [Gonioctena quinquepunctata]
MCNYTKKQQRLQKLMDEMLSDGETESVRASSDEYEPDSWHPSSSYSWEGSKEPLVKKTINYTEAFADIGGEGTSRQIRNRTSSQNVNQNDRGGYQLISTGKLR